MPTTYDLVKVRSIGIVLAGLLIGGLAITGPTAAIPTISITVTNSGSRSLEGLYLSLYADRGWGPDQLNGTAVAPGTSFVVNDVACASGGIVVIAEDDGGCFLYRSVSCSGDATWTITSTATRDCGR
jgi:hypothetical protein